MNTKNAIYILVANVLYLGSAFPSESTIKAINKIKLKEEWSYADLKAIAVNLEASTMEDGDEVFLSSIRFHESGDSMEMVFFQRVRNSAVGGWKVRLKRDGKTFVFDGSEWFDV